MRSFVLLAVILIIISFPSPTHSFIPVLKPYFSANPSHRSRPMGTALKSESVKAKSVRKSATAGDDVYCRPTTVYRHSRPMHSRSPDHTRYAGYYRPR